MSFLTTAKAVTFLSSSLLSNASNSLLLARPAVIQLQKADYDKIRRFKYPPNTYRRTIVKPEEYTTEPIKVQRLGGRHYQTGRVVVKTIGGGIKHSFFWVDFNRSKPSSDETLVERVMRIKKDDFCRTGHIALVAAGNRKRWILATKNMKEGDLVSSSSNIPRIPVRAIEGNSYALGALPVGTVVNSVERYPGEGGFFIRAAGSCGQIVRKTDGQVVVRLPSKREISVNETCTAVVGQVSNPEHDSIPLGSAQANRWLGNRPRSGLWHRKDGYCGRKIRAIPPVKIYKTKPKPPPPVYQLSN